ncbi:MAG: PilZ domain-containing protein [Acidimicrobiia bacterium]
MGSEKRTDARRAVDWPAHYRQPHTDGWRPCRLIDISESGAAIEAFELQTDERLTGAVELELRAPAQIGEMVRLHGVVRYSTRSSEGRTRAGIELEPSSALDADLLEALVRLNAFS